MWLLKKRAELSRDRLSSNRDQGDVGVQRYSGVQRLESCEQDDQDEDKVEIKTNSDFQSKSNFQKKKKKKVILTKTKVVRIGKRQ
jgi:hypothetical protein